MVPLAVSRYYHPCDPAVSCHPRSVTRLVPRCVVTPIHPFDGMSAELHTTLDPVARRVETAHDMAASDEFLIVGRAHGELVVSRRTVVVLLVQANVITGRCAETVSAGE
jgi:hypothetical protein